jgi:hypothetical protein
MARDKRLTLEQSQLISRVRTMGTATMIPIFLEDSELVRLLNNAIRAIVQYQDGWDYSTVGHFVIVE